MILKLRLTIPSTLHWFHPSWKHDVAARDGATSQRCFLYQLTMLVARSSDMKPAIPFVPLLDQPDDVLFDQLLLLDPCSIAQFRRTNKRCRDITHRAEFRALLHHRLAATPGHSEVSPGAVQAPTTWVACWSCCTASS